MNPTLRTSFLALVSAAALSSSATATVVWQLNPNDLNAPTGTTTMTYTQQGSTITATGYDKTNSGGSLNLGTPTLLYFKNVGPINGAFETGLGVVNQSDHELQAGPTAPSPGVIPVSALDFIQLDLTAIIRAGATSGAVSVTSVQSGESFTIFGSNLAGALGTQLGGTFDSSLDNTFVNLPNFGQYDFYAIAAATGDVIPSAVSADIPAVPEMNAVLPIIGLGVAIGSTHLLRRRSQKRSSKPA